MPEKKTTNSIHEEHRARMQERVARDGLTSLAAHEVLEYLLYFSIPRRDTNPLAHRLIQHFGGFCQVLDASEEELMQVQGIGPASARLLHSFRDVQPHQRMGGHVIGFCQRIHQGIAGRLRIQRKSLCVHFFQTFFYFR